jgi:photosystem II stability/assembly factor-like uncharacterized protein
VRPWVVLALIGALIGGCGDDGGSSQTPASDLAVPWIDPDGDPPIVGSLSVNPADKTLFMATNTGLFQVPKGATEPKKIVGQLDTPDGSGKVSEALVVRFVGPDALLGSGHPAAGSALPAALGLIRSEDAGRTWSSVSELGTADFHVLEPAGQEIVGALFQQPQVLVSTDEGKTWQTRAAPLPLVALEVSPGDPKLWIGSTDRGIFITRDAGEGWRQLDSTPNSRFAWSEDGTLYRIDPGGPVKVSTDSGESWEGRGSTGGEPQAMTVDEDGKLYVALIDGTLKASEDGGQTFTDQIKGG